jgi:hypothetical protein
MAVGRELPIIGSYDKQRFAQFNPEDCANWYCVENQNGKKQRAMYPAMGRRHINYLGINRLIFDAEPRSMFRSRNFSYFVVGDNIFRVDHNFNTIRISNSDFSTITGNVWFDVLYTPTLTYCGFTDGVNMYVHTEETDSFVTITDPNAPPTPTYIAAFGNRFIVSSASSSQYSLSAINLGAVPLDPTACFTIASLAIFAQEEGIIRQIGVNKNLLYIFTDYTTGVWSNTQSTIVNETGTATTFPLSKNKSYQFQWGMGDPLSLKIDFGIMVWEGQNQSGLIQVVASGGDAPVPIATKAIDVLFQNSASESLLSPFVEFDANGILYQYENTVFYRLSAGDYQDFQLLDIQTSSNSIEYNFDTKQWCRVIEMNGERNRIQKHIFFSNRHLVSLQGETTVYEMTGQVYTNELRNVDQEDEQAIDAYIANPMRYEKVTTIISEQDYAEFETQWVQIDFCWGDRTFIRSGLPFANTVFMVAEDGVTFIVDEDGKFLVQEGTDTPEFDSPTYDNLFKPHIFLYYSDDGGITYSPADNLQFSDLGIYSWRMRWYQLGCSRNRTYKLVCVSPAPIVVLGGWQLTKRVSGGAS